MNDRGKRALLIAGPTGSGKSALALALAERHGGVIVNADSMQVYRDMRILTARPAPAEEKRLPHFLYGHVDAAENYSVGRWCRDAAAALAEIRHSGRMPIVVGGTGLYFRALTGGLAAIPPIDPDIRSALRARLAAEGVEILHRELMRRDPASGERIMPRDRSRILRALEVIEATGRSMSEWHLHGLPPILDPAPAVKVFLNPARAELSGHIDARFDAMLAAGALDEVSALQARGLPEHLPALKAHGVPWLRRYLRGEMSLADAAMQAKNDTRRYAKRQVTWFRNQMPEWVWVAPREAAAAIENKLAEG